MFKHAHAYDAVSGGVAVAEGAHGRSDANTLDGNPGHGPAGRCAVELLQEPQTVSREWRVSAQVVVTTGNTSA